MSKLLRSLGLDAHTVQDRDGRCELLGGHVEIDHDTLQLCGCEIVAVDIWDQPLSPSYLQLTVEDIQHHTCYQLYLTQRSVRDLHDGPDD